MTSVPAREDLDKGRQLVLVVRLWLDADWQIRHGELVDVSGNSRDRFAGWDDLTAAVKTFIGEEREAALRAAN